LVVSHYPPYSDGKFDSDITMTTMRVNFMPLLDAAGMTNFMGGGKPDLIIGAGDQAGEAVAVTDAMNSAQWFTPMEDYLRNTPSYLVPGNHECVDVDTTNNDIDVFVDAWAHPSAGELGGANSGSEQYYSFDIGNIHVIMLDLYCSDRAVPGVQYNWLITDLAQNTKEWLLVVSHYPPYSGCWW
jgi:hypothetical protein